ncbi:MAG: lysophospholipid acyltransferase family protein [Methylotenera sp.]|nr:lysophospholipid acyltransferase family protein [Methylotenera sp.]
MLKFLLKPFSLLSLPCIHRLGSMLGCLLFWLMPESKKRIHDHLLQSKLVEDDANLNQVIKRNMQENTKALLESFALWEKKDHEVLGWVKECKGWPEVEAALAKNKGIIFLTPHLGCFEICSVYYGKHHPVTVLFRPPKQAWLGPLINEGRSKGYVKLAPANLHGVRSLMQALKKGEAIGILPDQIPASGEGEWADFFGKPAYTMTLASKLANKTGAAIIMAFGERLENGEGYIVHFNQLQDNAIATPSLLNQAIEVQVKQKPAQYLWQYPRYKVRRHAVKKETASTDSV